MLHENHKDRPLHFSNVMLFQSDNFSLRLKTIQKTDRTLSVQETSYCIFKEKNKYNYFIILLLQLDAKHRKLGRLCLACRFGGWSTPERN